MSVGVLALGKCANIVSLIIVICKHTIVSLCFLPQYKSSTGPMDEETLCPAKY